MKLVLGHLAHCSAGEAVAPRVEGRPGKKKVGLIRLYQVPYFPARLFYVLCEIIVAADDGGDHPAPVTQGGAECLGRAREVFGKADRQIGFILPPIPPKN